MTNLKDQVYLYSVSTDAFYNDNENKIHTKLMKLHQYKNRLKEYSVNVAKRKGFISNKINELNDELDQLLNQYDGMRALRSQELKDANKISQFFSTLTRTLGLEAKETTTDIIMVRAYHYKVLKSLIVNGFVNANGEHYQYFSSSAGMIRNKKSIFIKSSVAESEVFKERVWCGLNKQKISDTKFTDNEGNVEYGINMNKLNAYLALCMTSSIPFGDFDIDKAIVVDDFETTIFKTVDYIDKDTFKVSRKKGYPVTIPHMDGAGIMLPEVSDKALQFRMPHFKGLLIPMPYDSFITDVMKQDDVTVTDIYGDKWNIVGQDIKYIFTKSQFKMAKYYSNWKEYKDAFKRGCEFVICREEERVFQDKPVNYQALQTLVDATTDEMEILASQSNKDIANVGRDKEVMLRILGVKNDENKKDYFQKALTIYPELLSDKYSKESIRNTRDSIYKDAKAGKLLLKDSKRTFISPDLYAFCEWLFMGETNPKGLLNDGEVSCKLYENGKILDVLRAPHLYKEHALRRNKRNDNINNWFITNCIYTSVADSISKILMFDVDGDEAHIISNPAWTFIAKRNMKGIVPLEYELATSRREKIEPENIYISLVSAYSKNIGEISNSISKIWSLPKNEIDEEAVAQLCFINNAIIDFAKTLWIPKIPPNVAAKIKNLTSGKLPHYFVHAKDKEECQVEPIKSLEGYNKLSPEDKRAYIDSLSTVNKLEYIIRKKRLHFAKVVDKFDYRMLRKKKKVVKMDQQIIDKYNELNGKKKWYIEKELRLLGDVSNLTNLSVYDGIRKALLQVDNDIDKVVDTLVEYLYIQKPNSKKSTLWKAFGDVLLRNLESNLENEVEKCEDCETRFRKVNKNKVVCDDCKRKRDNKKDKVRKRKTRQKQSSDKKLA